MYVTLYFINRGIGIKQVSRYTIREGGRGKEKEGERKKGGRTFGCFPPLEVCMTLSGTMKFNP